MSRKSHSESEVERIAVRLWQRVAPGGRDEFESWNEVKRHLWGVSDGLRIAGKETASELADWLGFVASHRALLSLPE